MAGMEAKLASVKMLAGGRVSFGFDTPTNARLEMVVSSAELEQHLPDILRCSEAARQNRDGAITGYTPIAFSPVTDAKMRGDATMPRIYLILDQGKPNQIAYAIHALKAQKLAIEITEEVQKMLDRGPIV